jgi:hypothetical protein
MDVARIHTAANTMRNMFVNYAGGAYSRPGTRFVGWSAQIGKGFPPRIITFQFSINQGIVLEFGDHYMRVIINGAFVLEPALAISNVTQGSPGQVTAAGNGAVSATSINTNVYASYAPGDDITLAGGTFSAPAILQVVDTALLSIATFQGGRDYTPGDTITLSGGTFTGPAQLTVATTQVTSAVIAATGSGSTPGNSYVMAGTTGVGQKFEVNITVGPGGGIERINSILPTGAYTVNPTNIFFEPLISLQAGGPVGAALGISMGVGGTIVTNGGDYTVNPASMGQASTSGTGTGAEFISPIFGPRDLIVLEEGVYSLFPPNPVAQAASTGQGLGAQFNVTFAAGGGNGLVTGDWVYITDVSGMVQLNGQTFVIVVTGPTTFQLFDVFGNPVNTDLFNAYTGGGFVARLYTLSTIYGQADLEWLKFDQSADVMTICCVNQITGTEYPAQDLERFSDTEWVFTPVVPVPSIGPPLIVYFIPFFPPPPPPPNNPPIDTWYAYCVTAVAKDGTESIASVVTRFGPSVDISATGGSNLVIWTPVTGAIYYNIYKAQPNYGGPVPDAVQFGYAGSAYGSQWTDKNTLPDFAQVPPLHFDPFARGQIIGTQMTNGGANYNQAVAAVNSATGSGAVLQPVIQSAGPNTSGPISALLIVDPGRDYQNGDTVSIIGDGNGAQGIVTVGPETGTYPGVTSYFQQRRVFADSLNEPDTYWMSQPGAFTNFDSRIPTIASDAITGSPWSLQVDGIQFLVLMPAGLSIFTGTSAWVLVGAGSFATNVQPISPSSQVAQPLAFSGCSATLPPMKINYDILYVTSKGSYYYDLPYQLYALSEPIDLTMFSSHLFDFFTFREHCWAETPFKLVWTVRSDGCLLTLTYLKQQQVAGWARHDTFGHFWSITSVIEPVIATVELADAPTQNADAVYVVVERHPG